MTTFTCIKCNTEKDSDDRYKKNGVPSGNRCKGCASAAVRQWQVKNKERWEATKKRWEIERYGISESEYYDLKKAQNGVCAICNKPSEGERLHIDHCHKTGKVRGLLCRDCNQMLGSSRDNPATLEAAAGYLRQNYSTSILSS